MFAELKIRLYETIFYLFAAAHAISVINCRVVFAEKSLCKTCIFLGVTVAL